MKLFSVGSSSSTDSIFWVGEREVMASDDDRDIATPQHEEQCGNIDACIFSTK
jgi:hypothetical protein